MALENNLRTWREGASLSREQLAEKVGTSAVSIFRIEKGKQQPRPGLLQIIASVFGKSASDFYTSASNVSEAPMGTRRIRVYDFVQVGAVTVVEPARDRDGEDTILTSVELSDGAFALRIKGRSMEPLFTDGDIVLIDPGVEPRAEDFVAASDENGEDTFKRFHDIGLNEEGNRVFELVSLNPAYPSWRSDRKKITIRGTMMEHRRFRTGTAHQP